MGHIEYTAIARGTTILVSHQQMTEDFDRFLDDILTDIPPNADFKTTRPRGGYVVLPPLGILLSEAARYPIVTFFTTQKLVYSGTPFTCLSKGAWCMPAPHLPMPA